MGININTDRYTPLADMIAEQHKYITTLGKDPHVMNDGDQIEFIKEQTLALISELNEMLGEIGWKSWATSHHINRDAAFGELRDAWQFLTNLMIAVTGESGNRLATMLETELYRKHTINYQRIGNYDGVSTKCPECKRALDDANVKCTPDLGYCAVA